MSENREYVSRSDELGNIHISGEVLASIAAAAALEVEGVSGLSANLGSDIAELLSNKKNLTKGVHIQVEDEQVTVELAVLMSYGHTIPEVGRAVQDAVKSSVESMTGLTVAAVNVGVGLAKEGKKVLLIDADPQGDLTTYLGYFDGDNLEVTLADLMQKVIRDEPMTAGVGILHQKEGVDLVPSNLDLSAMEVSLVNAMSRERILHIYLDKVRENYDYVIIDCMPSLGMLTINALTAADKVIIPVQAQYLPAKGMTQLLKTISRVQRNTNPALRISGILLTLVDGRTNLAKEVRNVIKSTYSSKIKLFQTEIPVAVSTAESPSQGESIFEYDAKSPVCKAYEKLAKEVSHGEKERTRNESCLAR